MKSFEDTLKLYNYSLSPERIAQRPASPRDSAKLVVLDRALHRTTWTTFRRLSDHLPPRSLLVLNETKVIPARLTLMRTTGGKISILRLGVENGVLHALAPKKLRTGERLMLRGRARFVVTGWTENAWILRPLFPAKNIDALFSRYGEMPIPPYIKHSPLSEKKLRSAYQTVFARERGSIAAPTASLHFTKRLMEDLRKRGIGIVKVTLHVHLGTFAPLSAEQWKRGKLHTEEYSISPRAIRLIERAKREGRPVVAVGTTVARTLESAADASGRIVRPRGETSLFIREGHRFRVVDALITNFHVPKSSLLMLVAAFAGRDRVMDLYREAIERRLRFYSFGDAMLLL